MHIPDGVLDPGVLIAAGVASAGAVAVAGWSLRRADGRSARDRVGLAVAGGVAVLVAHVGDVALVGGHTAHVVGGALLAVALGPALALLTMAAVLALEALAWGDGGVAALGVNVLVMGAAGVLVGWLAYRGALALAARWSGSSALAAPGSAMGARWRVAAAATGALASVLASTAVLIAVLAVGAPAGAPVAQLAPHHLAWAALEATVTGALVAIALAVVAARARPIPVARHVHVLDGDLDTLG